MCGDNPKARRLRVIGVDDNIVHLGDAKLSEGAAGALAAMYLSEIRAIERLLDEAYAAVADLISSAGGRPDER